MLHSLQEAWGILTMKQGLQISSKVFIICIYNLLNVYLYLVGHALQNFYLRERQQTSVLTNVLIWQNDFG